MNAGRRGIVAAVTAVGLALGAGGAAVASDVSSSFVDTNAATASTTLEAGGGITVPVRYKVSGAQAGTATFTVNKQWTLTGGTFVGSDPETFTVAPRDGGDKADVFSVDVSVGVDLAQAAGTFPLSLAAFGITNSNTTGGKLALGTASVLEVTVTAPSAPPADATPPVVTVPGNQTLTPTAGSQATFAWTASAHDDTDGPLPVACSRAADTPFPMGQTTVTCTATDAAGNEGTASFTVTVSYAWSGFLRPVENEPTVNVVKAGSAVPVKFSLSGNQGLSVFDVLPQSKRINVEVSAATDTLETVATPGASGLSYDVLTDTYTYVWKTDKAWTGTSRQLVLTFADGSTRTASFTFVK